MLRRELLGSVLVLQLGAAGCAQIDVGSQVTIEPRSGPIEQIGDTQLVARDFVAEYVQVGPRLMVEIREFETCVQPRHRPVLRIEHVRRTTHGVVVWEFAVGALTGAFGALAFARPQTFSPRLTDGYGRVVYDYTGAYVVGGVFTTIGAGLLTAGIVDAIRSRDTTRYADAYEVELGPEQPCHAAEGVPLRERAVSLRVDDGVIELDAITDETGRARFELPPWTAQPPPTGSAAAVLRVTAPGGGVEPRVLVFSLRVPYGEMIDAQAGVADTRVPTPTPPLDLGPVEGPEAP